jgi:S-adenosylmethionine decarboxylase
MPGKSLFHDVTTSGQGARPPAAAPGRKVLHAVDATLPANSPASGVGELRAAATAAVRAGRGHVLDSSHVIFPNGAVTLVLILAESHLAIHTWPEEDRIAIDLFSCGSIDADLVTSHLVQALRLTGVRVQSLDRAMGQAAGQAGTDSDTPN